MTAIYTESFVAFGQYNGSDEFSPAVTSARLAHAANLRRAEFEVVLAANTSDATSGGLFVRDDPVAPGRSSLVHSAGSVAPGNNGVTAAFRRALPITDDPILIGFSVFIPADFVKSNAPSTVPCLRLAASTKADAAWSVLSLTPIYAAKECFRISQDLQVRWGTDAAQSSVTLAAGALNYVELEIGPNDVRVWVNDVFVLQKIVSLVPQSVGWIFENNINAGAGTQMTGNAGRWAIGNMYWLTKDATFPNVRLGPSTRCIGSRPEVDADVRFSRPALAPTNASVAGQDLVENPPQVLQAQAIGDFDLYSSTQGDEVADMSLVHVVASKVLASNLEPETHYIRGVTGDSSAADPKGRALKLLVNKLPFNVYDMAIRPGTTTIYAVGSGSSIYKSGSNFDVSAWTPVYSDSTGFICTSITFTPDGRGIVGRNTNTGGAPTLLSVAVLIIAAGADVVTAGAGRNTGQATTTPTDLIVAPDGRIVTASNQSGGTTTLYMGNSVNGGVSFTSPGVIVPSPLGAGMTQLAKNNSRIVGVFNQVADSVLTSDDSGATWSLRGHGASLLTQVATWDGIAFIIMGSTLDTANGGAPAGRRSFDASSWSALNFGGSNVVGAAAQALFAASNVSNQESIFGGTAGALLATKNGLDYRQLPRLTTASLRAGLVLPSGDFVISGDTGVLLTYATESKDTALVPFATYAMAFNSTIFNPVTGQKWTPVDAAVAQFGAKLTA